MTSLILANVRGNLRRLGGTAAAVILGVAFTTGTLVLSDTLDRTFTGFFDQISHGVDAVVREPEEFGSLLGVGGRAPVSGELVDDIENVPGVEQVEGVLLATPAQILGPDGEAVVSGRGFSQPPFGASWIETEQMSPYHLVDGRPPEAPDEVVIDVASAEATGSSVGDTVTISTRSAPSDFTVVGVTRFGASDSLAGTSIALFEPERAIELLGEGDDLWTRIQVTAAPGVGGAELADRIEAALEEGIEVISGEEFADENRSTAAANLQFVGVFLWVFSGIALLVGGFIIANSFGIVVAQRTRELALLRAIGAGRRQITRLVMSEAVVVALIASAVGIVAGIGLARVLQFALGLAGFQLPAEGTVVTGSTVITAMVVGVLVTLLSASFPVRRAAKVAPVTAMRAAAAEDPEPGLRRLIIGVATGLAGAAMLVAGLLELGGSEPAALVGLGALLAFISTLALGPHLVRPIGRAIGAPFERLAGPPGQLARLNATRSPRRTAGTASALTIGVAIVSCILVMADSIKASVDDLIRESVTADFTLDSQAPPGGGFPPTLADELEAHPLVADVGRLRGGVAAAARGEIDDATRSGALEGDDAGMFVFGFDQATFELFDPGLVDGSLDLGPDGVAISEAQAQDDGWVVGDPITVAFAGSEPREMRLAGVFETDLSGGFPTIVMDLEPFAADVGNELDNQVLIKLDNGVDAELARTQLEEITSRYGDLAELLDIDGYVESQSTFVDQLLGLIFVMLALAIVSAFFGIANTMSLSMMERTRELGLLRAVGLTAGELATSVRLESVIVSVLGTVLGVALGVPFGLALMRSVASLGLSVISVPFGQLATLIVLAGVAGVVTAAVAARRSSRLDVLEAIAT